MADEKMLTKVRALLAKAEASEFAAEAEAFTAKATQLMVEHAIDAAKLQSAGDKREIIITKQFTINGYAKAKMQLLYNVARAMGCDALYTRNTRDSGWASINVTVIGWESDIASIEVLFASLSMQVTTEMERAAKQNAHVHGRAFKQAFILGFAAEVGKRLRAQRAGAVKVADEATPGASLAVVERSTAVQQEFARRYPKLGKGTGVALSSGAGYGSGTSAGQRANLGQTSVQGGRRALNA